MRESGFLLGVPIAYLERVSGRGICGILVEDLSLVKICYQSVLL